MRIIDSHLHLWGLDKLHYPWLDTVPAIRRNFMPEDYADAAAGLNVEAMVVVEAACLPGEYQQEVNFIMQQAAIDKRIQAIVAYAPVEDEAALETALQFFSTVPMVKGVRRMYDDDPSLCVQPAFIKNVQRLAAYEYSFDISAKPHALQHTIELIAHCPETQFVLDHLGKPGIKHNAFDEYRKHIDLLSGLKNVKAKLSGLVTESAWDAWSPKDLQPYIDYAIEKFGFDRLMFGSDYPVVLLAAGYRQWITTVQNAISGCSAAEANALFYENAKATYRL